ncbi:MAG: hypothetical protein PVI78_13175 [Anaerolineales bacterium]
MKLQSEINDSLISASNCAICDTPALHVVHLTDYADYIVCEACGSSFVLEEGGERVLFGVVSEKYPKTEKAILKTWKSREEVEQLASDERAERIVTPMVDAGAEAELIEEIAAPEPIEKADVLPTEPGWMDLSEMNALDDLHPGEIAAVSEVAEPEAVEVKAEAPIIEEPIKERRPPEVSKQTLPQDWYRVSIWGERVYFPLNACVHCMAEPSADRLPIVGSLPAGVNTTRRRRAAFRLPLCRDCYAKSIARSNAQKNAQLQAHLTSVLVGLALVVIALGLGVVDLAESIPLGLLILAVVAGVGYLLPLGLLLQRVKRAAPLLESFLVRTTLRIRPPEDETPKTLFDFRNRDYAEIFLKANMDDVEEPGEVIAIQAKPAAQGD